MDSFAGMAVLPMLANLIVLDMYRAITEISEPLLSDRIFMLDLNTLEGSYHSLMPRTHADSAVAIEQIDPIESLTRQSNGRARDSEDFMTFIQRITSSHTGILHLWDEGDLTQLPLSQCRAQTVDPLSEGPADLLPLIVRSGLTHWEARKEAALAALEDYVSAMAVHSDYPGMAELRGRMEIGAGETAEEAVYRGLSKCLAKLLRIRSAYREPAILKAEWGSVEDTRCRFYLTALKTMLHDPSIGLGEQLLGFPVIWAGTHGGWYGSPGISKTAAIRSALQQMLHAAQNVSLMPIPQPRDQVDLSTESDLSAIPPIIEALSENTDLAEDLREAFRILNLNRGKVSIYQITVEPDLKHFPGCLYGIVLEKEEPSE